MEDMSMKTNEIVEIENDAVVEETRNLSDGIIIGLIFTAGAVAGHFIEKGAKAAWRWGKGKVEAVRQKKAKTEVTVDADDEDADAES